MKIKWLLLIGILVLVTALALWLHWAITKISNKKKSSKTSN